MSELELGLSVAVVSMLGTLVALAIVAALIYGLHRAFPGEE
ncbi:MAG TPA: hypothetical protein VEQ11_20290 [Chloroflexota bacterium]|nr:hypothetical protein [Chloroflexota bacterium]